MILHWLRETIEDRKRKDSKAQNLKIKDLFIHKKIIITWGTKESWHGIECLIGFVEEVSSNEWYNFDGFVFDEFRIKMHQWI